MGKSEMIHGKISSPKIMKIQDIMTRIKNILKVIAEWKRERKWHATTYNIQSGISGSANTKRKNQKNIFKKMLSLQIGKNNIKKFII